MSPIRETALDIAGMGIILYSPSAVENIAEGSDYLNEHFSKPEDVARHVLDCELTAFCTGSPGSFRMRWIDGPPEEVDVQSADYKLRLGLWVRDGMICVRDLYELLAWTKECPPDQCLPVPNGWYRLTVFSSVPSSGILGDDQEIHINLEPVSSKPQLHWDGVPQLCGG